MPASWFRVFVRACPSRSRCRACVPRAGVVLADVVVVVVALERMFRRDSKKMDLGGAQDNHNNRKDQAYAQLGLGTFGCCRAFRESLRCLASVNMAFGWSP